MRVRRYMIDDPGLAVDDHLAGDIGGEVGACEQATDIDRESPDAWSRLAHALARTDRTSEAIAAAEQALNLGAGEETAALLERLQSAAQRVLPGAAAVGLPVLPGWW